jgi:hypothetical protein
MALEPGARYWLQWEVHRDISAAIGGYVGKELILISRGFEAVEQAPEGAIALDGRHVYTAYKTTLASLAEAELARLTLKGLPGSVFKVTLTPLGEIRGFGGMDQYWEGLLDEAHLPPGEERDRAITYLIDEWGDGVMPSRLQRCFVAFPERPVAVGDSWSVTWPDAGEPDFPMVEKVEYSLAACSDATVTVRVKATCEASRDAEALQSEKPDERVLVAMAWHDKGSFEVDRSTGWPLSGRLDREVEMSWLPPIEAGETERPVLTARIEGPELVKGGTGDPPHPAGDEGPAQQEDDPPAEAEAEPVTNQH